MGDTIQITKEEFDKLLFRVKAQETRLAFLEQSNKNTLHHIDTVLESYMQQTQAQRGTRGMDFQMYQRFMSTQLAQALQTVEVTVSDIFQKSLPLEQFDKLSHEVEDMLKKLNTLHSSIQSYHHIIYTLKRHIETLVPHPPLEDMNAFSKSVEELSAFQKEQLANGKANEQMTHISGHSQEARKEAIKESTTVLARLPPQLGQLRPLPPTLKKCFYSALIGNPEQTVDRLGPFQKAPGWDYILFTNQTPEYPTPWELRQIERKHPDPAVDAKMYKWLSHIFLAEYDIVVWMDAYLSPDPRRLAEFEELLYQSFFDNSYSMVHRPHNDRTCIWDECDAVVKARRETPEAVAKNRTLLQKASMPRHFGLFDTNMMAKLNKDLRVQEIGNEIASILVQASNRDQLAVTYVYYTKGFTQYTSKALQTYFVKTGNHIRLPAYL